MPHDPFETIAAIASASGAAASGIVRISGPQALACVAACWRQQGPDAMPIGTLPSTRAGWLQVEGFARELPCQAYIWPTARSYTGEPCAELHTIGAPILLQAVLRTVVAHGARLARPGEFTLRAFLAGKIDLTQAEAVLGVIDAHDRRALDVALAQLSGGLGTPLLGLRGELLDLLAQVEAGLDFVEEDIEFISQTEIRRLLAAAAVQVRALAEQTAARTSLSEAVQVALVGAPNAGKSSLYNALLVESAALVSPRAGTTRDYLTARLDIAGIETLLTDTAGLSHTSYAATEPTAARPADPDQLAQQMTERTRDQARFEILCIDGSRALTEWELRELDRPATAQRLVVRTKADLPVHDQMPPGALAVSSVTGQGLDELRRHLRELLTAAPSAGDMVAATAARCHESLRSAAESLERATKLVDLRAGDELVAAEVRLAIDDVGQIVGAVYTDDLLDRIFSRFCIGK